MRHSTAAALAAFAVLATPLASLARPFGVSDLLHQESFRASALDPSERWFIFERTDPYDGAARYDYDQQESLARTRLYQVDLAHLGPAQPLLTAEAGAGVSMGAFSPSGARLVVYRLAGASWTLGVVEVATGQVRWLGLTPERSAFGQTLEWLSDSELLVIDRPDSSPPFPLRQGHVSAERLPNLWATSARGGGAPAVAGSGAYASQRPRSPPRRLLRVNLPNGTIDVLAQGEFSDLELAPDHQHVAVLEAGEDLQPRPNGPSQGEFGISTQAAHLLLLDLATGGRREPCPTCDLLPNLLTWSPDGAALLVFARDPASSWRTGAFLRIDARSGRMESISRGLTADLALRPELVHAGWMGRDPIALARPAVASATAIRADWFRLDTERPVNLTATLPAAGSLAAVGAKRLTVVVGGQAWQVDRMGRAEPTQAAEALGFGQPLPAAGRVSHVLPRSTWVSLDLGHAIGRLDTVGAHNFGATPVAEDGELVAISPARSVVVSRRRAASGVEILEARANGGAPVVLSTVNAYLSDVDAPDPIPIRSPGPAGQDLTSWLFLPAARDRSARPPLVVIVYPGAMFPQPARGDPRVENFPTDPRTLVGHGFAVLEPSLPRGTTGEPVAGLADQITAIIDMVTSDPRVAPRIDTSRVAVWGHSFGGYGVMAAITQSDRFCVAVAISGISDLTAAWATLPVEHRVAPEEGSWSNWNTGNTESGQVAMGAPPWADPARYDRNSPLRHADRIHTPLLLAHGDQDLIALSQSEAMFSALYRQDKDAELLTYWGEGHFLSSPGNVKDFFARAFDFLDRRLSAAQGCGPASGVPSSPP